MTEKKIRPAAPVHRPRTEALAFRIWHVAKQAEWNLSVNDLAEQLETPLPKISAVCRSKGWIGRLRSSAGKRDLSGPAPGFSDDFTDTPIMSFH